MNITNERKKQYLSLLLVAVMVLSMLSDTGAAEAAKKISLSKTSITVAKGKSKKVTIKNLNTKKIKKLTAKSNKPKVASVSRSGKNAIKVKGKKAGKARIIIRIFPKKGKKVIVLSLKVTTGDVETDTSTGVQEGSGENSEEIIQPSTSQPGDSTETPTEATATTQPETLQQLKDTEEVGLYDKSGTLQESWSTLLEAGDIVVVEGEIKQSNAELKGMLKIAEGVTSIGDRAFHDCINLTDIVIPNGVKSIGKGAFYSCINLVNVGISENVERIEDGAFYGCSSLKYITIPDSVTSIGNAAFSSCSSLQALNIPKGVKEIGNGAFWRVPHIYYSGTAIGSPWGAEEIN